MIVDCHTHLDFLQPEPDVAGHLAAADRVDACIVHACPNDDRTLSNEKTAQYVSDHANKMVGFAVVEPTRDTLDDAALVTLTRDLHFSGFVVYCSSSGFHPTHSKAMHFYAALQELGTPLFFHNGDLDVSSDGILAYAQPYLLDEVARTFPDLKMIIGCMGVPFVDQTLAVLARHENVYADLTIRPSNVWQTYNMVVAAHEQGVMDRLVFGSGYPLGNVEACIEALLGFNTLLGGTNLPTVPRGSIRNVVERNSLELLGIAHSHIESGAAPPQQDAILENQGT